MTRTSIEPFKPVYVRQPPTTQTGSVNHWHYYETKLTSLPFNSSSDLIITMLHVRSRLGKVEHSVDKTFGRMARQFHAGAVNGRLQLPSTVADVTSELRRLRNGVAEVFGPKRYRMHEPDLNEELYKLGLASARCVSLLRLHLQSMLEHWDRYGFLVYDYQQIPAALAEAGAMRSLAKISAHLGRLHVVAVFQADRASLDISGRYQADRRLIEAPLHMLAAALPAMVRQVAPGSWAFSKAEGVESLRHVLDTFREDVALREVLQAETSIGDLD